DPTLAPPSLAFADEEPLAQQGTEQMPHEIALAVIGVVGQQHPLDIFRLDDQEGVQEQDAVVDQVSVEQVGPQRRELVLSHAPQKPDQAEPRGDVGVFDESVWFGRRCRRHGAYSGPHAALAAFRTAPTAAAEVAVPAYDWSKKSTI